MKQFFTFAVAAALAAGLTNCAWSQGGQGGGGGTSGGAGTSGAAGTAGAAAGTQGATGTQGAGAAGQLQQGRGQVGTSAQGQFSAQPGNFGQTTQPWFGDPNIRQQLNLNDNQFNQLSRAYQDTFARPRQAVDGQANTQAQRQQRIDEFQGRFDDDTNRGRQNAATQRQQLQNFENRSQTIDNDYNTTLDQVFTDPQMRQRFDQLNRQYMGPGAFNDPTVQQQLNLNNDQQRQLRQLNTQWQRQLDSLRRTAGRDPAKTQQQWQSLRTQYANQLNSILNQQQLQSWNQMLGQPYDFPMTTYLPAAPDAPTQRAQDSTLQRLEQEQRAQQTPSTGTTR